MATLHQVILRRTGVYILPGEPANRWIIETPTITEGLRHRVRRILGPRIEELTELGVAIAQDSRAVLATMSYTEFDEFTADWKHLRGARGGRAFRRDFDMRQPHLSDRQRYTEQILHYITRVRTESSTPPSTGISSTRYFHTTLKTPAPAPPIDAENATRTR